ncbi:MAG TPA: hypothetical protein VG892_00940, partial [Terriglobales bacterium]|nr:hypothetical protein [Terriglobales bacterium]
GTPASTRAPRNMSPLMPEKQSRYAIRMGAGQDRGLSLTAVRLSTGKLLIIGKAGISVKQGSPIQASVMVRVPGLAPAAWYNRGSSFDSWLI